MYISGSGLDAFTFFFIKMAILFEYILWVCDTLGSSTSAKLLEIVGEGG